MAKSREEKLEYWREYNRIRAADPVRLEARRASARKHARKRKGVAAPTGERRTGTCPICLRDNLKLRLDHDHDTGAVRGWLCSQCNPFIGRTRDDAVGRAQRILAYVGAPQ